MVSVLAQKPAVKRQQKAVLKQISSLREQMEDLNDYLDLLEARARNKQICRCAGSEPELMPARNEVRK